MLIFPLTPEVFFDIYGIKGTDPGVMREFEDLHVSSHRMTTTSTLPIPAIHHFEKCVHFYGEDQICDFAIQHKMFCVQAFCDPDPDVDEDNTTSYRIYHPRFKGGYIQVESFQGIDLLTLSAAYQCFYSGKEAAKLYESVPFLDVGSLKDNLHDPDAVRDLTVGSLTLCRDLELRDWQEHLQLLQNLQAAEKILGSLTTDIPYPISFLQGLLKPILLEVIPRAYFGLSIANAKHTLSPPQPYFGPDAYPLRGGLGLQRLQHLEASFNYTAYCLDQKSR